MKCLQIFELLNQKSLYHASLQQAQEHVDAFCSSLYWMYSAHIAFELEKTLKLYQDNQHFALFAEHHYQHQTILAPLETMWSFGCPLITTDATYFLETFGNFLLHESEPWNFCIISGLIENQGLYQHIREQYEGLFQIHLSPKTIDRYRINLKYDFDHFLKTRSSNFRHSLQKSLKQSQMFQFEYIIPSTSEEAQRTYSRILDIEKRSWKGLSQTGLSTPEMNHFYDIMIQMMTEDKAARILFCKTEYQDIGYLFGGIFSNIYRALQFSFDENYRSYGIGNIMQCKQIQLLENDFVEFYDLGSNMEYKKKWSNDILSTTTIVLSS